MQRAILHVVEAHEDERASLVALLSTAGYVTRSYASLDDALASGLIAPGPALTGTKPPQPGIVIIGMELLGTSGLERLLSPDENRPGQGPPVLLMTTCASVQQAIRAMQSGASGILEKPLNDRLLFAAITRALESFRALLEKSAVAEQARERLAMLLPREREVLQCLIMRGSNKAIASDLGISPRTVELYRARIMAKTKASSLPELVCLAIEAGLPAYPNGATLPSDKYLLIPGVGRAGRPASAKPLT